MDHHPPEYVAQYLAPAEALLKEGAVKEPLFSNGTYQFEIKKAFPFLQMKDDGEVTDSFCSCKVSETGKGCPHLAAAYLRIFNGHKEPLHVRFQKSLWRQLFFILSRRFGYEVGEVQDKGDGSYLWSFFRIQAADVKTKKRLHALLFERPVETEETSIKFSNLPPEEIAAYRRGYRSEHLLFELSFWSEVAKWLMYFDEIGENYEILFSNEPVPQEIKLHFPTLDLWFSILEEDWPLIIPALATVKSPLKIVNEEEGIEKVVYDEEERCLLIQHKKKRERSGIFLGEWLYVKGEGFYRASLNPLLAAERIESAQVSQLLPFLTSFLPVFSEPRSGKYFLSFDEKGHFHIELYVFQPGDLKQANASCFFPWVYLPERGFYLLDNLLFEEKEKVIAPQEMAEFINRNRLWLHHFPGFQTHLGSLESHLTYQLTDEGLKFYAELNFPQENEEMYHFDEWVYIKGQGFYMKKEASGRLPLHPGLLVAKNEIASFIQAHKEDLEQVSQFFNLEPPMIKTGLQITINPEGKIAVLPKIDYAPGIHPQDLVQFGDYIYVKGKGFYEISPSLRLPERYQKPTLIEPSQEAPFLAYELEALKPYIAEIDPRLILPDDLKLKIYKISPSRKKKGREWLVDLRYISGVEETDVFSIWDAFQSKKKHLFSSAGLLNLKEARFHWIRQLPAKRLDRKKGVIRLNTLEWIRLTVLEEIAPPQDEETRHFLKELEELETDRFLDISHLKATLRPYQEQGLKWLWFLYCHGLSGLLCDDMGLGKTHQAMGLLAAVSREDEEKENKYLVVCPTSVIYHWQEQLKRFLPHLRVSTYYGLERTLDDFEANYDLLLTSYGILRTGKENLKAHPFEVAIFDEIQIAKNHASQTHKALRSIKAKMRLGLTGTPIENRIRELKALLDIVVPSYMPPDPVFREAFVNPIEKYQDASKQALLGKLVKPFILRRKKSEVLTDLPEKIEEIAYCDLTEEQKKLYSQVAFNLFNTLYEDLKDSSKPVQFVHVFSALSTLKQICDHPSLILGNIKQYHLHPSGKWDLFVELLEEARNSGQKVVVFSQYLDMLSIMELYLKKQGIGFACIKGSTRDRPEQLRKFRDDPGCEVFLASLLAAGVGIDLTVASIVIHYDRWWNPAKENQATDRVHRIGQNRGVQVFKLVTKNSIEEHIHQMIERKKGLLEEVIGQEDQINYLSRDELLKVFELMFSLSE